jgi:Bacterial Ig-like domain (group 2)
MEAAWPQPNTQQVLTTPTWTSSNTAVAMISNSGLATPVAAGSTLITATGSTYSFTANSYLLDGTLRTAQSGAYPNPGTCSNGVVTVQGVPTSDGGTAIVTAVLGPDGLWAVDLGLDSVGSTPRGGAVGTTTEIGSSQFSSAMGAHYMGFIFKANSTPITSFVGFGAGNGNSLIGGTFANQNTDPFSNHGTDTTITLQGTSNSQGFLQGNVVDSNGQHEPFICVITQNGEQYFLYWQHRLQGGLLGLEWHDRREWNRQRGAATVVPLTRSPTTTLRTRATANDVIPWRG